MKQYKINLQVKYNQEEIVFTGIVEEIGLVKE